MHVNGGPGGAGGPVGGPGTPTDPYKDAPYAKGKSFSGLNVLMCTQKNHSKPRIHDLANLMPSLFPGVTAQQTIVLSCMKQFNSTTTVARVWLLQALTPLP